MPEKHGNRTKRKLANRSRVKRAGAKAKRIRSLKRKHRAKRGPR